MTSSFIGQRQIQSPTWTSKIVQGLANRGVVPKVSLLLGGFKFGSLVSS